MIGNSPNDRMIDASGEFNTYVVPMNNFGAPTIIRAINPATEQFLYDLSKADGADQTRVGDDLGTAERNGEPFGELGLVAQGDALFADHHGSPSDPQNTGHGTDSTGGTGGTDGGDGGDGGTGDGNGDGGNTGDDITNGNNGVGNGEDPAPTGNDGDNDDDGAAPGNPGNAGGNGNGKGNGKGKK